MGFVVGVENYQPRREGQILTKVDFARNDAEAFADVLKSIYPADRLSLTLLRDSEATCANLKNDLGFSIKSLAPDDLFIFYYAGHGFHPVNYLSDTAQFGQATQPKLGWLRMLKKSPLA